MTASSDDVAASNSHIPHAPPSPIIPEHLIEEILLLLPVENLLQLCRVCKSWKSLILHPNFAVRQLRMSPRSTRLILCIETMRELFVQVYPLAEVFDEVPTISMDSIFRTVDRIVGSCDGIICFLVKKHPAILVLWNPCIRKYKILPPQVIEWCWDSYTIYGFGYDSTTKRYKVVEGIFHGCESTSKIEVKVLTLGTNTWRRIGDFPYLDPTNESGKLVSGTLNWLAYNDPDAWVIISLDLHQESYEEVLQPDYGEEPAESMGLNVFRGCLSIIFHTDMFFDVWVMKDYGKKESWTKLFRVPYQRYWGITPYSNPLIISEDDQILLNWDSTFFIYDPRYNTLRIPRIKSTFGFLTSELYFDITLFLVLRYM